MQAPDMDQLITYSSFSAEEIYRQISMRQTGVLEFPVSEGNLQIDQEKWIVHTQPSVKKPVAYSYFSIPKESAIKKTKSLFQ